METGATLISAIGEGVGVLSENVFQIVTDAVANPALLTIMGIVIAYGAFKFARSFLPTWRG